MRTGGDCSLHQRRGWCQFGDILGEDGAICAPLSFRYHVIKNSLLILGRNDDLHFDFVKCET